MVSTLTLLLKEGFSINDSLRFGVFQTVSIVTTTGYTLEPLSSLGNIMPFFIFIIAFFIGACSGSVGGRNESMESSYLAEDWFFEHYKNNAS